MVAITTLLKPEAKPATGRVISVLADRWLAIDAGDRRYTARYDGGEQIREGQTVTVAWAAAGPVATAATRFDDVDPIEVTITP